MSRLAVERRDGREAIAEGDRLRKEGRFDQALTAYRSAADGHELVPAHICLKLARTCIDLEDYGEAWRWTLAVVDSGDDFASWQAAAALLARLPVEAMPNSKRSAKLALLSSYTTTQFGPMLELAAARLGIRFELYQGHYGQYRQEIIDPQSPMYGFGPDFVLLAVHEGDLALPDLSQDPDRDIQAELQRWTSLWHTVSQRTAARIVQHNIVLPPETPMGHLGFRLPGSRYAMTRRLNSRLGEEAAGRVSFIDAELISSLFGKNRWFDPRFWFLGKYAVAPEAHPLLARHTAAVIAADLGLSRKCLVLDLDNTLWGGVIGEDGLAGIKLGDGVEGEAYVALQEYIRKLKNKGIILAVCSKNNPADAREPFEKHPEMRIKLDDIAVFAANWRSKPENIRDIAEKLNIGLDSLVLLDDNPVEREAVRQFLPEVDVISLPADPSRYVRALAEYLMFETTSFTVEDAQRADQYRARAQIAELESSAESIEDFHRSLKMRAIVRPFDELNLPRIAQLIGKTNQFNLTTRRHGAEKLREFMADPDCVHLYLRLRDRFADHGLVSVAIARREGEVLDIDTWLMSCRVIGRTVEAQMLHHLCVEALRLGCSLLRGTYVPTAKNAMVGDVYGRFGFEAIEDRDKTTVWQYNITARGVIENGFIDLVDRWEENDDGSGTS